MNPESYYRANEDLHFKLTTPEEERDLFRKAKAGDAAAREFLIKNHLLFCAMYARRKIVASCRTTKSFLRQTLR